MDKQLLEPSSYKDAERVLLQVETMTCLPVKAEDRERDGLVLWQKVYDGFLTTLPIVQRELYVDHLPSDPAILHQLGIFICDQCVRYGDERLSMCPNVNALKFVWTYHDPDLMERYLDAAKEHAAVIAGRGSLKVSGEKFLLAMDKCGPQLDVMFKRFRGRQKSIRRPPTNATLEEFIADALEQTPQDFSELRGDRNMILARVRNHPDPGFAVAVRDGHVKAVGFLEDIMAPATGQSVRTIQRKVKDARAAK